MCLLRTSGRGDFTKRFGTTALRAQKGIQAIPNVTRQEQNQRGMAFFVLTLYVGKTGGATEGPE